jgi:hypothetical protein
MSKMDKSIAESHVVTQEVKTWRLRANAIIRHARLRFGSPYLALPLTW